MGCVDWFIHGELDWDRISTKSREYGPCIAGALFAAGWWCWVDALVYSQGVLGEKPPLTYHLPGWVATLALVMMNLVSRDTLANLGDSYGEDGAETRAKCWLFVSYVVAFGAVAGSVVVLVTCVQHHSYIQAGVGSLLQCGLILLSALLFWAFRTADDSGYTAIY